MRSLLLVVASFFVTILGWGLYVPMLRWGQVEMSTSGIPARWRPFVCVGLAYFLIGVIVPIVLLKLRGERGHWTTSGVIFSLLGGALGALGALGIILAINFGGNPIYVAPLVFGSAPVVNAFLTIFLAGKMREIGPVFLAGLVMVVLGAVTVLMFAPHKKAEPSAPTTAVAAEANSAPSATAGGAPARQPGNAASRFVLQLLSIAMGAVCWGAYGPTLHKGQAGMMHSRLRPLLCVGLAYFAIAVIVPNLLLLGPVSEASRYTWNGSMWSLLAGAAGAIGALGIIMAFNFGGKPVYVMPLVFGGAPVVATLTSMISQNLVGLIGPMFLAGLILVIAGAAMVLVFAPKGHAPTPAAAAAATAAPAPSTPKEAAAKNGAGI
ncbi:MAG: hypothetical protein IT424_15115 [Pirellulales bacterium]|nr:hypothetical protein [Pirellulales bacterium]